ncbi:hypothetical protein DV451_000896 [Geotrichum candidum]|uniref:chitinase n=1 Tax=Geotrichum candidum TaxID=1173061 RepID=A0A9P5KUX6_GEOCN|nr:hypothetical protein DV451_000896 [Geotrichum candidum]
MKLNLQKVSTALLSLLPAVDAFSASGSNNVVLYWGQASAGSQESLGTYCESTSADMYVLSFLAGFPESQLTIHGCAGTLASSCPDLAADIKYCQSLGKKVLLSLGGAVGSYGFTSDQQAINYASTLWNSFGGGTSTQRPFGDAVLDGFDLDIENGDPTGYAALTTALRKLYAGGDYYIGAAPQCVYPDASLSTALANGYFDFVFVQFYNNKCSIDGSFNWATWAKYAADYAASTNPNVKLYLGLPGSSSAASSGYASISSIQSVLATIQSSKYFGGVMLWDASQAFSNVVNGVSFVSSLKALLTLGSSDSVAGESSPALSAAVPKASSSAKQSGSLAASTTVVYNEWGYPVVASASSSAASASATVVYNEWGYPVVASASSSAASASATVVYNEWGYPVVASASSSAASASATVVYNEWGYPVVASSSSSAAANQWVAASSSAAANQWVAASSSAVVNEWAAATSTVVESVAATTVVAVEAAASSTNQESESAGNVNNGLWNPDTSAKPDDGYWKTGKYEGGSVNKLVVGDLPVKKEVSLSSTASSSLSKSSSVASSAAFTTAFAAASFSTAALSSTSAAVSSSVDAVSSTSAVASSSTVAVSSTSAVVSSSASAVVSSSTSAVVSSSTSAVVSSSSAAVSSTSAAASSSTVALSSTPVAVESISSSAPTISDAAVEPTYSPITSTITITTTSIPTFIPSASISSAPKSSFLFSSFTTVRSAAPAVSSSAQTSTVATTSVAPVSSNTVASAESTLASSTSVESATLTKTSASESTSQSVTKSLKVVNAASVPDRCNDRSQGHLDSCLNTLFETEKQPVELAANDVTDSNASAALPEVGVITQANSASSDSEQGDGLACTREGAVTCKDGKFAICNFNKWVLFDCPASTTCKALTINDIETVVGCNWV